MDALLKLLKGNARLSNSELAVMLNCSDAHRLSMSCCSKGGRTQWEASSKSNI